ncbi:hypothetical protein TNCV_2977071, partial [Trichonephila clavipes]
MSSSILDRGSLNCEAPPLARIV